MQERSGLKNEIKLKIIYLYPSEIYQSIIFIS
jgi:hypothetical protein